MENTECLEFTEHVGWRNNKGGVTWDAWCSDCGFRLENKPFGEGLSIQGNGRKLGYVVSVAVIGGEIFISKKRKIVCSKCCPIILSSNVD